MRYNIFLSALLLCLCAIAYFIGWKGAFNRSGSYTPPAVLYCQDSRCDREIVDQISKANKYIYFAVYTITRPSIVDAVIGAKMRGVDVRGITDFNQSITAEEKPQLSRMRAAGIPIEAPIKQIGLMHIKLLVTDSGYVSGSFNWTTSATSYNDEIIESGKIISIINIYKNIFLELWSKYSAGIQ